MENSVVGIFENDEQADAIRRELLQEGFAEQNVGVFVDTTQKTAPANLSERIKSWFGESPDFSHRMIVTVYTPPEKAEQAAQILQRHQPMHLTRQ